MADEKSITITEGMLDAGFKVLKASGIADEYSGADRLLLADIFRAMYRQCASRQHSPSHDDQSDPSRSEESKDVAVYLLVQVGRVRVSREFEPRKK